MSSVYYKFKSQKTQRRITFDGTGISVFDLKREIVLANKLEATASSFDLRLTNPDTGEVYQDDAEVIPRSTAVEVRRVPNTRQNDRNTAARYVSGHLSASAKNASRREVFKKSGPEAPAQPTAQVPTGGGGREDEMMQAIFQAQGEQWKRTQEEMAEKAPVYFSNNSNSNDQNANNPPPPTYVCYRCAKKGHWIGQCPTLDDPNWEPRKVRKPTGIPKSMLRTVEKPSEDDNGTYLMTNEGEYVKVVADENSWQDFQNKQKSVQQKQKRPVPENLQDPITHELMENPKLTPCCSKTYSDQSIQTALINNEFECPNCNQRDVYIDELLNDTAKQEEINEFQGEHPDQDDENEEVEIFQEYMPRKSIRRASTSTYSESVSSRDGSDSEMDHQEGQDSDAYMIDSPGYEVGSDSDASVGAA